MCRSKLTIEEVTDPAEIAQAQEQDARMKLNSDWLQAHWPELVERARGRHIAVAGQEAYIADTPAEAWAMAMAAHPDNNGAMLQYVIKERGPRIYAYRR